jgi:cation:H+ antiporter
MPAIDNIYFWVLVLFAGLFILVKAANYFNKAAEVIGLSFGMSPFIIGVMITAIGTSLPELITSAVAVSQGASEIVPGNVTGSNITNIFLIIGIVAIVHQKPIHLISEFITVDLQFLIGSALFITLIFMDNHVSTFEGFLCLAGFFIYFHYLITSTRRRAKSEEDEPLPKAYIRHYLQFLLSGVLVFFAAKLVIDSVVYTSEYFDVGTSIVAAGVVAFGTSLPELVVSLDAVKKGKSDYAMGNIMGSSIFNSFLVVGFSSLFGPIIVPDVVINFILPVMLIATFLFFMLTRDRVISAWEGALFLVFYVFFISRLLTL